VRVAYVFTLSAKVVADPVPGPGQAPELARYDRLTAAPRTPALFLPGITAAPVMARISA
jgi:hypothetical protein